MELIVLSTNDYHATISGVGDATGFTLHWHDYVVNEWSEWYATLPQALIRLATLEHCSQTGEGFIHAESDFVLVADAFLKGTVNA
jgi:hypothetical protein